MQDWYQDIIGFCKAVGQEVNERPVLVDQKTQEFRERLILEEINETCMAMDTHDLVGIADGITDSIVVLLGTAIAYGIDIRPIWLIVHASNMAKVNGPRRFDGKILKPEGWKPPDVKAEIERQKNGHSA